jgi:hypothetical protein
MRERLWGVLVVTALAGCQRHEPEPSKQPLPVLTAATGPIGIRACDDYLRRVAACAKLSPAARAAFASGAGAWQRAAAHPGASAQSAEKSCKDVADAASAQLTELGC